MRLILSGFVLLELFTFLVVSPDTTPLTSATKPVVSTNSTGLVSPEINADNSVTFRLHSATATDVIASGDFGELLLTKDTQNVWSATTAPLAPAIYRYSFIVDGVQSADPGNPDAKGKYESLVTVPGNPPMPWEIRDVPHGHVISTIYYSKAFKSQRSYLIYTPPGYETSTDRLPVLYLLHGYSDDDSSWTTVGKADRIADNLLADNKIKPVIIVMPYGQLNSDVTSSEAFSIDFQQKFERQILDEIIPSVENNYRVASDARHRAMAGVSMGGMQTAYIGLNHPDTFSTIAMWSSAIFDDPAVLLPNLVNAQENIKHSFLYIHVGVGREDPLLDGSNKIDDFLTSHEVDHEFMSIPGTHSWILWRSFLVEFMPKFSAVTQ